MATVQAVPSDLVTQYQNAVSSGDTSTANYLAQAIAGAAGLNANNVTAAPNSLVNPSPGYTNSSQPSFLSGLLNFPLLGGGSAAAASVANAAAPVVDAVTGADGGGGFLGIPGAIEQAGAAIAAPFKGVGEFFDFITNIPRVLTILIGVILVIVGLYMLGNKQIIAAVSTVAKTVPDAAVAA